MTTIREQSVRLLTTPNPAVVREQSVRLFTGPNPTAVREQSVRVLNTDVDELFAPGLYWMDGNEQWRRLDS